MKNKNSFVTFLTYATAFALLAYECWLIGLAVGYTIAKIITNFDAIMGKLAAKQSCFFKTLAEKICGVSSHEEEDDTKIISF